MLAPRLPSLMSSERQREEAMSYYFSRELHQFLDKNRSEFNTDLIDAFLAESPQCEVQVNVRTDVGKACTRKMPDGRAFNFRIDGSTEVRTSAILATR